MHCNKQSLTRKDLEKYQLEALQKTVVTAIQCSHFYKSLYAENGVTEHTIQDLQDLEKLPFTSSQDLRLHGLDMVCVPNSEISRIVTLETSGTTAPPKRVYFTKEDQELTIDFFHKGMRNIVKEADNVLILMPCKRPGSVGALLRRGLERMGVNVIPLGPVEAKGAQQDAEYNKILNIIEEREVTSIVAVPFQLAELLKQFQSMEGEGKQRIAQCLKTHLKTVLLSADYVPEELCKDLERVWACHVFEHYGMTEMGLGCAVSCAAEPNGQGYHVREKDIYIEIVHPETGQVLPEGAMGEVVFTTLTRKGMPFIRYRTGDISRWRTEICTCGGSCPWGGDFKKLDKIGQRAGEKEYR